MRKKGKIKIAKDGSVEGTLAFESIKKPRRVI